MSNKTKEMTTRQQNATLKNYNAHYQQKGDGYQFDWTPYYSGPVYTATAIGLAYMGRNAVSQFPMARVVINGKACDVAIGGYHSYHPHPNA